jgi:hypothetical protein
VGFEGDFVDLGVLRRPAIDVSPSAVRFVDVDARDALEIDEIPRTSSISTRPDPPRSTNLGSTPNFVDPDRHNTPEIDKPRPNPLPTQPPLTFAYGLPQTRNDPANVSRARHGTGEASAGRRSASADPPGAAVIG